MYCAVVLVTVSVYACDESETARVATSNEANAASLGEPQVESQSGLTFYWQRGTSEGPAEEQFGRIVDAAFDPHGNAYLLDVGARSVRVFGPGGAFLGAMGGSGWGDGELIDPRAILHDGDETLYVLDAEKGIAVFRTTRTAGDVRLERTVDLGRIGLRATDFCLFGSDFLVYALRETSNPPRTIHRVSSNGRLLDSMGDRFGPEKHVVQGPISLQGKIACFPDRDIVVVAPVLLPDMRAYKVTGGSLVWSRELPAFEQVVIDLSPEGMGPGFYTMTQPPGGASLNAVFEPFGSDRILSQTRRAPVDEPAESISTCLVSVENGTCQGLAADLPLFLTTNERKAVAVWESLWPIVRLVDIGQGVAELQ